jgi:hypothetical protein
MTPAKIDKTLKGLPISERVGALIVSLAAEGKDSLQAIQSLIGATAILGKNLPDELDRLCCASALRACATAVEADHVPLLKD